jgi:O-acetyl-ADP-ribose deacetylase (regulator of RNase III)
MIVVVEGSLSEARATAILRPVTSEWEAPTSAMRRLEMAAGPEVESQCRTLGELPVGTAVVTPAGNLPVEFLVHIVIRSVEEPVTPQGLRRALGNGLRRLAEWAIENVALPPLGTGAGNLDPEEAADVMVPTILEHMDASSYPESVQIVVETAYEREIFEQRIQRARARATSVGGEDSVTG